MEILRDRMAGSAAEQRSGGPILTSAQIRFNRREMEQIIAGAVRESRDPESRASKQS
jgi:hypothetical protein